MFYVEGVSLEMYAMKNELEEEVLNISIATLKFNKKYLKSSVIKQIPHKDILDLDNFCLRGIPLGHINLFFHNENFEDYWHILWDDNGVLTRCVTYRWVRTKFAHEDIKDHRRQISSLEKEMTDYKNRKEAGEIKFTFQEKDFSNYPDEILLLKHKIVAQEYFIEVIAPAHQELLKDLADLPQFYIL